jgi:formylglycine-generating enzyme required for sulfatase activity
MYSPKAQIDPLNNDPGKFKAKVIRGGSFKTPAASATTYYRNGVPRDKSRTDLGFRCVREIAK